MHMVDGEHKVMSDAIILRTKTLRGREVLQNYTEFVITNEMLLVHHSHRLAFSS